ncbi:hypothetical protein HK096_010661, partial [Nowakowskiella sp. JEL0078]
MKNVSIVLALLLLNSVSPSPVRRDLSAVSPAAVVGLPNLPPYNYNPSLAPGISVSDTTATDAVASSNPDATTTVNAETGTSNLGNVLASSTATSSTSGGDIPNLEDLIGGGSSNGGGSTTSGVVETTAADSAATTAASIDASTSASTTDNSVASTTISSTSAVGPTNISGTDSPANLSGNTDSASSSATEVKPTTTAEAPNYGSTPVPTSDSGLAGNQKRKCRLRKTSAVLGDQETKTTTSSCSTTTPGDVLGDQETPFYDATTTVTVTKTTTTSCTKTTKTTTSCTATTTGLVLDNNNQDILDNISQDIITDDSIKATTTLESKATTTELVLDNNNQDLLGDSSSPTDSLDNQEIPDGFLDDSSQIIDTEPSPTSSNDS